MGVFERIKAGYEALAGRTIELQEEKKEIGATGTEIFSGFIDDDEFNSELENLSDRVDQYQRMRTQDAQVAATELAVNLPELGATKTILPASDDKKDQEVADFVAKALRIRPDKEIQEQTGTTWTFEDFHRQAHLYKSFGFMAFEWQKQNIILDGKPRTVFRKIAPRLPKTVYTWEFDEEDNFKGIRQEVYKGGVYRITEIIPADKLVLFVNRREGNNLQGVSMLRPAYAPWKYKRIVLKIVTMGIERDYLGIWHGELPQGYTSKDVSDLTAALENLRAHQKMYVITPPGYKIDQIEKRGAGKPIDVRPILQYYDEQISAAALLQFIMQGVTQTGSRATTESLKDFFMLSLEAHAGYFEDVVNLVVIPNLVRSNFQDVTDFPKLRLSNLKARNLEVISDGLSKLAAAGILFPDKRIEDHVREIYDLPEREGNARMSDLPVRELAEFKPSRELVGPEKFVDFAEIDRRTRAGEKRFVEEIEKEMDEVKDYLAKRARVALQSQDISRMGFGKDPLKSAAERIGSFESRMARKIESILKDVYAFGRDTIKDEVRLQKEAQMQQDEPIKDDEEAKRFLKNVAAAAAGMLMFRLIREAVQNVLQQMNQGTADVRAVREAIDKLSPRAIKEQAVRTVMTAFNLGRKVEAARRDPKLVIRSEVMDTNTCSPCAARDGDSARPGTAKFDFIISPPYPDCEASAVAGCRGIAVFEFGE